MANLARFTIDSTPSSQGGFDVDPSDSLTIRLEASSQLVGRVTFEVAGAQYGAPRSTAGAPTLTLNNGSNIGQAVDALSPGSSVTLTGFPATRVPHLWEVRCKVNGGTNQDGSVNPDYVFSRIVAMRSMGGSRKILANERGEYDPVEAWASAFNDHVAMSGTPIWMQVLTSGTTEYVPTLGTRAIFIECIGGGGGGGGCATGATYAAAAGGGGGGAYSCVLLGYIYVVTTVVSVGTGGAGGAAGANNGSAGNNTQFGSFCIARGGSGGGSSTVAAGARVGGFGGTGGLASFGIGTSLTSGETGERGLVLAADQATSGRGGASRFGFGGARAAGQAYGSPGSAYGGGGSGGSIVSGGASVAGGDGAAGVIRVWEFG